MFLRGKYFVFIGKAILFLILASIAWYFISPAYNQLLALVAERLVPSQANLTVQQSIIYINLQDGSETVGGIYVSALHYGLLLVIALIAATPGLNLFRRFKFAGIAILSIFVIHLITIVIFVRAILSSPAPALGQDPLVILLTIIGCDLFPVLIWAIVAYRHFTRKSINAPVNDRRRRLELYTIKR